MVICQLIFGLWEHVDSPPIIFLSFPFPASPVPFFLPFFFSSLLSFLLSVSSAPNRPTTTHTTFKPLARRKLQLSGGFRRCNLVVRDSILHFSLQFLVLGLISEFFIFVFLMKFCQILALIEFSLWNWLWILVY